MKNNLKIFKITKQKLFCFISIKMRLLSKIFQPVITIPKNAKIKSTEITCKSQKLLLEHGLLRPTGSGFFAMLPLAQRSLHKLENIIRKNIESVGGQRISLPVLTSAALWRKSGRLTDSHELMKLTDRHDKTYLLSPVSRFPKDSTIKEAWINATGRGSNWFPTKNQSATHEESIADLIADVGPISYKHLPLLLYQISNKYRDEFRPKHGLLRAREFSMMDAYGVHENEECARKSYERVREAYGRVFRNMDGLDVYRVQADPGTIGGAISHEWHVAASAGEDRVCVCDSGHRLLTADETCERCGGVSSVEIGHTFLLGTKYSLPLSALVTPSDGSPKPVYMACYGIGVTRLLATCVEALSSDDVIRWPRSIAPYSVLVIGPKEGSKEWSSHGIEQISKVYETIASVNGYGDDVILDDRHSVTIGKRLLMADRMGYPFIVVCGKATQQDPPKYELYITGKEKTPKLLTLEEITTVLGELNTELEERIKVSN